MHSYRNNLLILLLAAFSAKGSAITVNDYTSALIKTHPYLLQLTLSEKESLIEQKAADTYTDWTISSSVDNTNTEGDDITARLYNDLNVTSYEVSANKTNKKTGADISLKHSWSRKNQDNVITGANAIGFGYSLPLLQNRGGLNDRLGVDLAAIEVLLQKVMRAEQSEDFIASMNNQLIELAFAQEKEAIYRKQLSYASEQLKLTEQKFNNGLVERSDVLREQETKLGAEQQWHQSHQELQILKQELASEIEITPSEMSLELNLYQLHPIANIEVKTILPSLRLVQQIQLQRQKLIRQNQSLNNQLLPSVNFNFNLNSQGEADSYFDGFSNHNQSWAFGVEMVHPLGQNKANLDLASSKVALSRLNARLREVEMKTSQQINSLVEKINLSAQMMQMIFEQKLISADRLAEEELKFTNARGQKSALIAAKKSLNMINLSYAQAATSYQKSVVQYRALIDQLL